MLIAALQPNQRWAVRIVDVGGLMLTAVAIAALVAGCDSPSGAGSPPQPAPGAARAVAVEATTRPTPTKEALEHHSAETAIVADGFEARVTIPDNAVRDSASITVEFAPSPSILQLTLPSSVYAPMGRGLLHHPSREFMFGAYSNMTNARLLRRLQKLSAEERPGGPDGLEEDVQRAQKLLAKGYRRLQANQHDDGSFSRFDDEPITTLATAYGLTQLAQIDQVTPIDASAAARKAARWLIGHQAKSGAWDDTETGQGHRARNKLRVRSTSLTLWGLHRAGLAAKYKSAMQRGYTALDRLIEEGHLTPYERALAANAYLADGKRDAAIGVLDALAKEVQTEADLRYWYQPEPTWTGVRSKYANITATALVVRAMVKADVHRSLVAGAMKYLGDQWMNWGFVRTDATIWAVHAVLSVYQPGAWNRVRLEARVDGRPMLGPEDKEVAAVEISPDESAGLALHLQLEPGEHTITVEPNHATSLIATATTTYKAR